MQYTDANTQMPINLNFNYLISITITLILFSAQCNSEPKYTAESLIQLEQQLQQLKSEIDITKKTTPDNYINKNLAAYYIIKKRWSKSLKAIKEGNDNKAYKHILYGIALQGLGRKTSAIHHYNKATKHSYYYAIAQLNIALLHMHDGHINTSINTIENLLSDPHIKITKPLKNKILLTLGYLYIKVNKFHQARINFRKINKNSIHSNKALIGIALAASKLNDSVAALHILSILKNNHYYDLPSDEAFILMGFTYESHNDYNHAGTAYQEAINHYIKRTEKIELLLESNSIEIDRVINNSIFVISDNIIDLSNEMPDSFFNHYLLSKRLLQSIADLSGGKSNLHQRAAILFKSYNDFITALITTQLIHRKSILLDYLNQSRYRLAVSNDSSTL